MTSLEKLRGDVVAAMRPPAAAPLPTAGDETSIRPLFGAQGRVAHLGSAGHDGADRVAAMERLARAAMHDGLTGLPNRTLLVDRLEQAIAQARRNGERFAVAMLDVDRFEAVNDSFGRGTGDAVLRAAADRLRHVARDVDTVARLGGDEFALLLPGVGDADHASRAAARILAAFDAPLAVDGGTLPMSASVGLCVHDAEAAGDAQALLRVAERAMDVARRAGGGRSHVDGDGSAAPAALQAGASAGAALLAMLQQQVPVARRMLHAGDAAYRCGQEFASLYVLHAGSVKLVGSAVDGREQVLGLRFSGDWLGSDGIAGGRYRNDAVAMDTSEVWSLPYDTLLRAGARQPALLALLHAAMSRELAADRDTLVALNVLPATARVAAFVHHWAAALAQRGLRTDRLTLRLTRAEIGNHLGLTLSTVSRAMTALARERLIGVGAGGRELAIPDVAALDDYVRRTHRDSDDED